MTSPMYFGFLPTVTGFGTSERRRMIFWDLIHLQIFEQAVGDLQFIQEVDMGLQVRWIKS